VIRRWIIGNPQGVGIKNHSLRFNTETDRFVNRINRVDLLSWHHGVVGAGIQFARDPVIQVGVYSPARYRALDKQEQFGAAKLFDGAIPRSGTRSLRHCD
jgi:hypothetical protein